MTRRAGSDCSPSAPPTRHAKPCKNQLWVPVGRRPRNIARQLARATAPCNRSRADAMPMDCQDSLGSRPRPGSCAYSNRAKRPPPLSAGWRRAAPTSRIRRDRECRRERNRQSPLQPSMSRRSLDSGRPVREFSTNCWIRPSRIKPARKPANDFRQPQGRSKQGLPDDRSPSMGRVDESLVDVREAVKSRDSQPSHAACTDRRAGSGGALAAPAVSRSWIGATDRVPRRDLSINVVGCKDVGRPGSECPTRSPVIGRARQPGSACAGESRAWQTERSPTSPCGGQFRWSARPPGTPSPLPRRRPAR